MNSATQATTIPVPHEVSAFAIEQGVSAELPAVLEMTRQLFPAAEVSVHVEEDPAIVNDRHIVVVAKNVNQTVSEALNTTQEWTRGLFARCPAPLVCVFRLGLEGVR